MQCIWKISILQLHRGDTFNQLLCFARIYLSQSKSENAQNLNSISLKYGIIHWDDNICSTSDQREFTSMISCQNIFHLENKNSIWSSNLTKIPSSAVGDALPPQLQLAPLVLLHLDNRTRRRSRPRRKPGRRPHQLLSLSHHPHSTSGGSAEPY